MYSSVDNFKTCIAAKDLAGLVSEITESPAPDDEKIKTTVETYLTKASSIVDTYLAKVYTTPLPSAPEAIINAENMVAKCMMYKAVPFKMSEAVQKSCDSIERWLEQLAAGKVELPEPPAVADTDAGGKMQSNAPLFTFSQLDN